MILSLLAACFAPECDETTPCGFGGTCDRGRCVVRSCTTSTQCPLDHHCTPDGACALGCEVDGDCRAGEVCEAGACAQAACTDTRVDCRFRELCVDGTCVDAGDPFCAACTTDAECGPGNVCWAGAWCAVDCSQGQPCPAAFECLPLEQGGATHQVCVAACWLESD